MVNSLLRIICVNTGTKFENWYVDNLKHMIDTYSCLQYDKFHVITEDRYDDHRGVFNKLLMFEKFTKNQYLYFDLDMVIKGDCNRFISNSLHVCHAWWRDAWHTPLNSSIISWKGDVSYIHKKFAEDPNYNMVKHWRGVDKYLYENFQPKRYYYGFCSYQTITEERPEYPVVLFNQRYEYLKTKGWWNKFHKAII